ncbi:Hypothetical protein R9X50_00194900 [Acrodontium crateriforme]|uniref:Major facilitator superfamily (MFS) profile domain-containing protein n=1 Tax=Acrodontium crateriforme TaxID=150365 RepID=A0AAQ3M0C2_9PEZI|nr:Hypothetical protein R9X50_00194900 [Acrodontium crateriforme]
MSMTETESVHELHNYQEEELKYDEGDFQSLPPTDRGRAAWSFLAACFVVEAMVWGFPFSFGTFQVYYASHEPFNKDISGIATIGTTATGLMYFGSPFASVLIQRYTKVRRPISFIALAIMIISLVAASFCDTVPSLIATQGALYAIGGILLYFPAITMVDEWFVSRKGLAYGIMWAGGGTAGIVVPFLLQWLLDAYGHRTALRVWAIIMTVVTTPCVYLLKGRLPISNTTAFRPINLSFLTQRRFWVYQAGNIFQSLGYFLPSLYLPSYASTIGLPTWCGTVALVSYNVAYIFGSLMIGFLVDRFHISIAILFSSAGAMFSIFVFWGLAVSQPLLYTFAIVYGLFGGGFSATWSGTAGELQRVENKGTIDTSIVISLLAAGRGVGAVVSGPLSAKLIESDSWKGHAGFGYGSGYGQLVVFCGMMLTFGGLGAIGKLFKFV